MLNFNKSTRDDLKPCCWTLSNYSFLFSAGLGGPGLEKFISFLIRDIYNKLDWSDTGSHQERLVQANFTRAWKLERKNLSIANQTLAMIIDLLSIMSKDGVLLFTGFNVTRIYPVIITLHERWFSLNETWFP